MSLPIFSWTILILLVAGPTIYLTGRVGINRDVPSPRGPLVQWLAVAALLIAWVPYLLTAQAVLSTGQQNFAFAGIALQVDGLTLLMSGVVLGLGTLVSLYSGPYMAQSLGEEKYYAMLVTMIGVIVGLSHAADLFNLWVWFEAMAVSSYLLVAFYRRQAASLEAGIKYVVQSATGSVLVLFGIALVLAQTGTLELSKMVIVGVQGASSLHAPYLAAIALFVIGFGVKVALVPLHTWLPDAHSQAPSGISAMLSGVVIEAGLLAMLRSITPLLSLGEGLGIRIGSILMFFGALNMLYGNLLALRQKQVKRLLAYSSLSHVGYMLVGVGVALFVGNTAVGVNGAAGAFFHLITHALMKGLAFLAVGALMYGLYISKHSHAPLTVDDLSGTAQKYPWVALTLGIALLALGGMPPLAGFMSKWQIFIAGFQTQNELVIGVVIFAAFNSVLSLAYYAPLVNAMYRKQPCEAILQGNPIPARILIPLFILALVIIFLGFWPSLISPLTEAAAGAILQ